MSKILGTKKSKEKPEDHIADLEEEHQYESETFRQISHLRWLALHADNEVAAAEALNQIRDLAFAATRTLDEMRRSNPKLFSEAMMSVAEWPVMISLHPKEPDYHTKVIDELEFCQLGTKANRGKIPFRKRRVKGPSKKTKETPRETALMILQSVEHHVASVCGGFKALREASGFGTLQPYIAAVLARDSKNLHVHAFHEGVDRLKSMEDLDVVWSQAGIHFLSWLRPDLAPVKKEHCLDPEARTAKINLQPVSTEEKRIRARARIERDKIRKAFLDLKNSDDKSHSCLLVHLSGRSRK